MDLWFVQAKCLSYYLAGLVAPSDTKDAFRPDPLLGYGDVMHITALNEIGETVALFVPGAFRRGVWRLVDPELTKEAFDAKTTHLWATVKSVSIAKERAVPMISDGKQADFVSVSFAAKSDKAARVVIEQVTKLLGDAVELCENKFSPESRFVQERGIEFSAWFRAEDLDAPNVYRTNERHEWVCRSIQPVKEGQDPHADPPPIRVLSFDIETYNKVWDENNVAKPEQRDAKIYSVALTSHVHTASKPEEAYYVLVRPPCAPPELTETYLTENTEFTHVYIVRDEDELIQKVNDVILTVAPVIITGHCILTYDLPWILKRGLDPGHMWARRTSQMVTIRATEYDTGAAGQNDTNKVECERIILDLKPYMKKNELSLPDYKLNTIAEHKLPQGGAGRKKIAVRYEDQHRIYTQSSDLEEHLLLARYVYTDADLVMDILVTYNAFFKLIGASRISRTPLIKMMDGE